MDSHVLEELMEHGAREIASALRPVCVEYARHWYQCAMRSFKETDFEFKANIHAVQTVAIMTLCNMNFDESEREWLLMGLAIQTARHLRMHRLGSESSFDKTVAERPEWATVRGRQLGRRLWWTLVVCDW